MFIRLFLSFCVVFFLVLGCKPDIKPVKEYANDTKIYKVFDGDYSQSFNDLHQLHLAAAQQKGITPMSCQADTLSYNSVLVRIPKELDIYNTDTLKYSVPFLVKDASDLLTDICINFRDSLISKKLALYKPIITSITRTNDDVALLTKRNRNAADTSAHQYATTFDISWRRFKKVDNGKDVSPDKLKFVLAQVLFDLRERERCFIKHERRQACFHITAR